MGIFALVIVTTSASFAFFTYSRTGTTTSTIISGDIEFSFIEGTSATLANAFPVADSVGAVDTTGEYSFEVKLKSSSNLNKMNYNVGLVDNNNQSDVNYFNNEQIKFSLVKNNTYVAGSSTTTGVKLSSIPGFEEGSSTGVGYVLENQEITAGTTDSYKLRIWISDDVDYSNTQNGQDNQESIGKYNSYTYSLKVKVTSGLATTISVDNLKTTGPIITAELSDPNGLAAYAITNSNTTPLDSEWIEITNDSAKSKTMRLASSLITRKTITHEVATSGTYYLHIKNKKDEVITKEVKVNIEKYNISFDGNGGTTTENSKEVTNELAYGDLPTATRTGYVFDGSYTSKTDGEKITKESIVNINSEQILYARWISKTFASKENVLEEFTGTTAETIMCSETESGDFYNCDEKTLMQTTSEERDGRIFLLKDVEYNEQIKFEINFIKIIDFDNKTLNGEITNTNGTLNMINGKLISSNDNSATITLGYNSNIYIENMEIIRNAENASIWGGASCSGCRFNFKNSIFSGKNGIHFSNDSNNSIINIENSKINVSNRPLVAKGNNQYNIVNSYLRSDNSIAIEIGDSTKNNNTILNISGDYPVFDTNNKYVSGMYVYSSGPDSATVQITTGRLKINGGYIYHNSAENGTWRQIALRMEGGIAYLNGGTFESVAFDDITSISNRVIYLNQGNAIVNVNGANIAGGIVLNYNENHAKPDTTAYICKGNIEQLSFATTHELTGNFYVKSSGITWKTQPIFGQYVIQDDSITCQ